jgi:alpha-L-rhamnosidase
MKSYNLIFTFFLSILFYSKSNSQSATKNLKKETADPVQLFLHPPNDAKPGVLWMWMGSNVNKEGITKDLEALKQEGISFAMISNLADVTNPWGATIENSPTPDIIGWTEPWWKMMQFAASEARRLDMKLGIFNCPGYETSGGPWISPELSMQQLCWSNKQVNGNSSIEITLDKPKVDPRAYMPFPVYDTTNGLFDYPILIIKI